MTGESRYLIRLNPKSHNKAIPEDVTKTFSCGDGSKINLIQTSATYIIDISVNDWRVSCVQITETFQHTYHLHLNIKRLDVRE
jgi:hypothetical protein